MITLLLVLTIIANGAFAEKEDTERGGRSRAEGDRKMILEKIKQMESGDEAPTFKLKSIDGKKETDLKEFRGKSPVVLIFGSYT